MSDLLSATTEFTRLAGLSEGIGLTDKAVRRLRYDLLHEEMAEYCGAEYSDNPVGIADGLADIIVVAWGTLLTYFGEECATEIAAEVWRTNLAKVDGTHGDIIRRGDGKLLKPAGWTPPDIRGVLSRHGLATSVAPVSAAPVDYSACGGDVWQGSE